MMRLRDRVGLNIPPLFLRVMLGIIFVWAGLGKVSNFVEVQGEEAAALANMGVIKGPSGSTKEPAKEPVKEPVKEPAKAGEPAVKEPPKPGARLDARGGVVLVRQTEGPYTAADFSKPVRVRAVFGLAAALHSAGNVKDKLPLWPAALATGQWPIWLAWAVALTELAGGISLLLGLLTRLWSFAIAGVMVGAIWLTQVGPAVQSGKAILGFLPTYPAYGMEWMPLMFQFSLLAAALALAFCGPGRLSLDTMLLGGSAEGDDDDE